MNLTSAVDRLQRTLILLLGITHLGIYGFLVVASRVHNSWHERHHCELELASAHQSIILFLFRWSKVVTLSTGVLLILAFGTGILCRGRAAP